MLKIRLRRMGKRHRPFYRVVVSDSRDVPTAPAVEELGHYDPVQNPPEIRIDVDRIHHWVGQGAQMSATIKKLVKGYTPVPSEGETPAPKAPKAPKKEAKKAPEPATAPEAPEEETAEAATAEEAEAPEVEASAEESSEEAPEAADADAEGDEEKA